MATRYSLLCPCGNPLIVEATQAGQTIACPCGASTEVPRMSELRALDQVADSVDRQETPRARWTWYQGLLFVAGTLLALVALFALVNLSIFRSKLTGSEPPTVTETIVLEDLADVDPEESWLEWQTLRNVDGHRPRNPFRKEVYDPRTQTDRYLAIAVCSFVVGILIACSGILLSPK